ncbi:uncharacterized protein LOC131307491 isoform X1 [Rhododendron vialii]|uniref:uncharacterized protein LOC131307491 isoform X1 n=1 Tax=Rhododendron vialii TaxID=182163 RepID=UPI00265D970D|nr:uncharacterized protein LOC131307491 isoform X1 [Rhododendron vialii]
MVSLATALGLCSKFPFPNPQSKEKMALRQLISFNRTAFSSTPSHLVPGFANFSSKSTPYIVKVGIPEFLNGVGKGVETHVEKLESEIGDIQKLLVTRTLKLKKLGIPCKHVLIFSLSFWFIFPLDGEKGESLFLGEIW